MPSFSDTVELERAFLKHLTSNSMMARLYMHRVSEETFTSTERKFVYAAALETLKNSKSVLTRTIFEYEVGAKAPDEEVAYYIGEWNLIEGMTVAEHPDALLVKLEQARVGRKALVITEEVVGLLQAGNIEEAVTHLKREAVGINLLREDRPLVELTDFGRRLQTIMDKRLNPAKYLGVKTGFGTFDAYTGGLFAGELTLLAGITGVGKSTVCKQLAKNIATLNVNKNVLHIANEEYLEQVEHKYDAVYTTVPYLDFKLARISDADIEMWKKTMLGEKNSGAGKIFIKEVAAFTDVGLIEQAYRTLENKGIPIHVIIIDHLPHITPLQKAWGENDERAKAASDCKELARWLRTAVVVPTQAATEVEKKQSKGERAGKLDVYGSKGQIHVANTFFIVTELGKDETQTDREDSKRDVYWLVDVKKNRDGASFSFRAKHLVSSGRVVEVESAETEALEAAAEAGRGGKKGAKVKRSTNPARASFAPKGVVGGTVPKAEPTKAPSGVPEAIDAAEKEQKRADAVAEATKRDKEATDGGGQAGEKMSSLKKALEIASASAKKLAQES